MNNIKLYVPKNETISNLKKQILNDDLNKLNDKYKLKKNTLDFIVSYVIPKDKFLEVGCFIRNTYSNEISLGEINLALESNKKEKILLQTVKFKDLGEIPSLTAISTTILFHFDGKFMYDNDEEYNIRVIEDNLIAYSSIKTKLEGIPLDISFEEESEIISYVHNLEELQKNKMSISIFKTIRNSIGDIEISLVFRNTYNKTIKLTELPITILNYNDIPVCKYKFQDTNGIVKIESGKAKFVKFKIDKSKIYNTVFDLDRCKILFQ